MGYIILALSDHIESDTFAGRMVDVVLLIAIRISVFLVIIERISDVRQHYNGLFFYGECFFTILFTIEYICRLISVKRPVKYALSFYGIIDFIAIVPS